MNINGSVPFVINRFDTIVRREKYFNCLHVTRPTLMGPYPPALTLLGGTRYIAWNLSHPFLRGCRRGSGHFGSRQACLGNSPAFRPTSKRPCTILSRLVRHVTNSEYILTAFGWAVLIGPGCLTLVSGKTSIHVTRPTLLGPQKTVPQALTLLIGARFIPWHLGPPYFRGNRRNPRNFCSRRVCLGYGPGIRPT